jgi:hypothetical protein
MPKHTEEQGAREAAQTFVSANDSTPGDIVNAFPIVEFETFTKTIEGVPVTLRRVVLVGPLEVVK